MTPTVDPGQIRFVLSWPLGPKDLDLHSYFKISRFSKCEIYFGKRSCVGTDLDVDNFEGGPNGVETITISTLGNYVYTFAVNKYVDISNGQAQGDDPVPGVDDSTQATTQATTPTTNQQIPDTPLAGSNAKISVYINGYKGSIYNLVVPVTADPSTTYERTGGNVNDYLWWYGLCLNGNQGISSLTPINKISVNTPDYTLCQNVYTPPSSFIQKSMKKMKSRGRGKKFK
jgi:hypothetical protein